MDPVCGNVAFSAAQYGWSFTLEQFAQLYCEVYGEKFNHKEFARRLWGDLWFMPETRKFVKKAPNSEAERSFIQFILEPIYKIHGQVSLDAKLWSCLHGS